MIDVSVAVVTDVDADHVVRCNLTLGEGASKDLMPVDRVMQHLRVVAVTLKRLIKHPRIVVSCDLVRVVEVNPIRGQVLPCR